MVVEGGSDTKKAEQCPLLNVTTMGATANGDNVANNPPHLKVECLRGKTWLYKWKDYISACWMGIFLVAAGIFCIYSLAAVAIRRQALLSRYVREHRRHSEIAYNYRAHVFCHVIVDSDGLFTFEQYYEYLSHLSEKYPYLYFDVAILVDDSAPYSNYGFRSRFIPTLLNKSPSLLNKGNNSPKKTLLALKERNKNLIYDFYQCHNNMNVSFELLSKFIAEFSLGSLNKNMYQGHSAGFMARLFSVRREGGVAFDLVEYNRNFKLRKLEDDRITEIFENYNSIDHRHDQSIIISIGLTQFDITNPSAYSALPTNKTQYNIDDISVPIPKELNVTSSNGTIADENLKVLNVSSNSTAVQNTTNPGPIETKVTDFNDNNIDVALSPKGYDFFQSDLYFKTLDEYDKSFNNMNKLPDYKLRFFYDLLPSPLRIPKKKLDADICDINTLTFDLEGKFFATKKPYHPFLDDILQYANRGRFHKSEKSIIEETIRAKCEYSNDSVCETINIL